MKQVVYSTIYKAVFRMDSGFRPSHFFALFSINKIIKNSKKSKTLIILITLIVWLILGLGGSGGWTLTFVDVGCMYIISINQRIKRIQIFDFLINIKKLPIHIHPTSTRDYTKTDKDDRWLGHMAIIPFPVLYKCRNI